MECDSCPLIFAKTQSCPVSGESTFVYSMVALSVFPYILCFTYVFLFLLSPSPSIRLTFKAGLSTMVAVLFLKEVIQQDRPFGACSHSYGMPSNHSALTSCFVTVQLCLSRGNWRSAALLGWLWLGVVCSRVYLNYHTPMQCMAGSAIGIIAAIYFSIAGEPPVGKEVQK